MTQTSKRWQYIKKMMQAYENYISRVFKLMFSIWFLIGRYDIVLKTLFSMKKLFYKMTPTQAPGSLLIGVHRLEHILVRIYLNESKHGLMKCQQTNEKCGWATM